MRVGAEAEGLIAGAEQFTRQGSERRREGLFRRMLRNGAHIRTNAYSPEVSALRHVALRRAWQCDPDYCWLDILCGAWRNA